MRNNSRRLVVKIKDKNVKEKAKTKKKELQGE